MIDNIVADGVKAMLFDCDGTLVDSMPLHMQAWQNAFNQNGLKADEDYLFSLRGMKETEIVGLYNKKYGIDLDPVALVQQKHIYFSRHISSVQPIDKVAAIAMQNHGRIPMAVVSGSLKEIVHTELKVTGLFDLFDVILTADDPYEPKPAPDIFIEAARRLGMDAQFCQVFEDGDPGLEAAKNAGMIATDIRLFI